MLNWVVFYLCYLLVAPFVFYLWRSSIYEATANLRENVFKHLQRLPIGYHELHHSGDALSILTNDVSAAEKAYQDDLLMLFEAIGPGHHGRHPHALSQLAARAGRHRSAV